MADILIVEDEVLVAYDMEATLDESGHRCVGIAADLKAAESFFETPIDLALVDLNLRDGLTGPEIGHRLSAAGVPVIFITANPAQIGDGVAGTIGVITKPTDDRTLREAVSYALDRQRGMTPTPPVSLQLFA